ncbi:MAG: cytochrome c biogenesis protein ResB [Planctomycetota bacterium]
MHAPATYGFFRIFRPIATLWFAAVLLALMLVSLACATVYESMHGTEQALASFYSSTWFTVLLWLFCMNVGTAVLVRLPLPRSKYAFALTHLSLILILGGALVTRTAGIDGQMSIVEGQTANELSVSEETLTLTNLATKESSFAGLARSVFGPTTAVDGPGVDGPTVGQVRAEVLRYLPDAEAVSEVVNDAPLARHAAEVSLSGMGEMTPQWIFDGEPRNLGRLAVALTVVADEAELQRRLEAPKQESASSVGTVKLEVAGQAFELPIERCRDHPAPLGDTAYTVRVVDYFPHATVGADNQLTNASDRPANPAIRAEIIGPSGRQTKIAFAKFPDFSSMHGAQGADEVKMTFVATGAIAESSPPVEIFATLDGKLLARFSPPGGPATVQSITLGSPVETPWPRMALTVSRSFDHARARQTVQPVIPVRDPREAAMLVRMVSGAAVSEQWVRKHETKRVTIDGTPFEVAYDERRIPLGFSVTLNKFTLGYYPGGMRPRSFESQLTIADPSGGRSQARVVSMNHPTSFGGFTFYQSSYQMGKERATSVLSVSKDPGQPIVFAGYFGLMGGMLWVLGIRMGEHRRRAALESGGRAPQSNGRRPVSLLSPGSNCVQSVPGIARPASPAVSPARRTEVTASLRREVSP